jgi:DNA helicase-2/ATP-dependent DNA helicase PcrA
MSFTRATSQPPSHPTNENAHAGATRRSEQTLCTRASRPCWPGAGKTWLVAEMIRQELDHWSTRTSGIAALSFTRVGGDEIRRALGHEIGHPHFVGTIDAFLFRYVIRPHLRHVFSWFADPRLVPGEWGAEHWRKCGPHHDSTAAQGIRLFACVYIGEENGKEIIARSSYPGGQLSPLSGDVLAQVQAAKTNIWRQRGLLTHSDAAFWAAKVLEHSTFGPVVRAEIIRRFPFLIVDELQDTGHFLGKSIRLLLEEPTARGLLVGDPDQAIYEFTGARPDLFSTFEAIAGAVPLCLASSQRCSPVVAAVATHVKDSGGGIGPASDRVGRALLVRYDDMAVDVPKVVEALRANRLIPQHKVIARGLKTVEDLAGRRAGDTPSLHCLPLTHIHRAVVMLRRGRNASALAIARAALERAVFQHEGVHDEELATSNIDPSGWKALAIRCLLKANAIPATGTSFEWHTEAGAILDSEISRFALDASLTFVTGKLKPKKRDGWNKPSSDFLPPPTTGVHAPARIPVSTVHGVKGETHDVTVFVCPPTGRCPSVVWWSTNDKDREEKRIAYVAMTRTRGDLIVCVSDACYQRLVANRIAFVGSFECVTVAQCVIALGQGTPTNQVVTK